MNYYLLKSLISAGKDRIEVQTRTSSFGNVEAPVQNYIEPSLEKVVFDTERPSVVLVSAAGATGKSALARQLSHETGLPLLDLGVHKAVGDNTLTGVLTGAYPLDQIGRVLQGLRDGAFGIIVDGMDEGRSKTSAKAFEAFLDDIAKLVRGSPRTTIILCGRTNILDETWLYLSGQNVTCAMLAIAPFDLESARRYIDTASGGLASPHRANYEFARDALIEKLGAAFKATGTQTPTKATFSSFIGYPPVLDAVSTLLAGAPNFQRLSSELEAENAGGSEVQTLRSIARHIAAREQLQKVVPNIAAELIELSPSSSRPMPQNVYNETEQSHRLVSYVLGETCAIAVFEELALNERYEQQLAMFLAEHPFLAGGRFRNAVFEAYCLANLIISDEAELVALAARYIRAHKNSYHLIYMLARTEEQARIPIEHICSVLLAAMEFRSAQWEIDLRVNGGEYDGDATRVDPELLSVEIEVFDKTTGASVREFKFVSEAPPNAEMQLLSPIGFTTVVVPCSVKLTDQLEFEMIAPLYISAMNVHLNSPAFIARSRPTAAAHAADSVIGIEAKSLTSDAQSITVEGANLIILSELGAMPYPLSQFSAQVAPKESDPKFAERFKRLRRILLEFRSHSKGSLAKYRHKIEHDRVLRNEDGRALLQRLLADGVLRLEGVFYHVDPTMLDLHLGITWLELRQHRATPKLRTYLRSL